MRAHFRGAFRVWDFRKTNLPAVEAGAVFYHEYRHSSSRRSTCARGSDGRPRC